MNTPEDELRDRYAGYALIALLLLNQSAAVVAEAHRTTATEVIAKSAFEMAEAMMKEREQRRGH
jgi:hypothetical protein